MNTKTILATAFLTLCCLAVAMPTAFAQKNRIRPTENNNLGIYSTYIPYGNRGFGRHLGRNAGIRGVQSLIVPGSQFGERIDSVRYGSPAYRAGLERGDIIVGFVRGGRTYHIRSPYSLDHVIQGPERYLRLRVRNVRNGRYQYVTIDKYDYADGCGPFGRRGH